MSNFLNVEPLTMEQSGLTKDTFQGQVAVITGAGSNIGLGYARSLAWAGCKVVLAELNPETGVAAEKLINEENGPGTALFVMTDVADELSMKRMAEKAFKTYDKVDIFVSNAMNMRMAKPVLESTIHQMDAQYAIACRGTLMGIQLFVPGMQRRKHGVVVYSSTAFCAPIGPANYAAAKAAASSLMQSLAYELGSSEESGIGVFSLIPAGVGRIDWDKMPKHITKPKEGEKPKFPMEMPGFPGFVPPEVGGAALAYAISRAKEIHGSGFIVNQILTEMDWPFPKPETAPKTDYERISDMMLQMLFAAVGPGFPNPKLPLTSLHQKDAPEFPAGAPPAGAPT